MNIALLVVASLLVVFVIAQAVLPAFLARGSAEARARHDAAMKRGADPSSSASVRARALLEAGQIALAELGRARLSARHAAAALTLAPDDHEIVALAVRAMTGTKQHRALERTLWRVLGARAEHAKDDPAFAEALEALVALYDGPLRAHDRAKALRALRGT